PAPFASA
nr:Chain B, inhibitor peptide [synthetic construct]